MYTHIHMYTHTYTETYTNIQTYIHIYIAILSKLTVSFMNIQKPELSDLHMGLEHVQFFFTKDFMSILAVKL